MLERSTTISNSVIDILKQSNHPLSASKIMQQLNKMSLRPNKTTIYRIIKKLLDKKIITEITIQNGAAFYEFTKKDHHHFICNQCDTVFCLHTEMINNQKETFKQLLKNKPFIVQSHKLNLYGLCEPCAQTIVN